jgi:hypothetical protein
MIYSNRFLTKPPGLYTSFVAAGSSTAPAFSPSDIPGLRAWYDAELGAKNAAGNLASVDDRVQTMTDLTGSGYDAVNVLAAQQPIRKQISGRNLILFDGADDRLVCSGAAGTSFSAYVAGVNKPFTTVAVFSYNVVSGIRAVWAFPSAVSNIPFMSQDNSGAASYRIARRADTSALTTTLLGTPNTAPHQMTVTYDGVTLSVRLDKTLLGGQASTVGQMSVTRFSMGAIAFPTASNFLSGYIGAFTFYDSALGSTAIDQLEDYMSTRFSI